jgi:hypothetical protein
MAVLVGGIAWEILALEPKLAQNFIPSLQIGKRLTGFANCYLQEQILNNSKDLLRMLRVFMLLLRTPESLGEV